MLGSSFSKVPQIPQMTPNVTLAKPSTQRGPTMKAEDRAELVERLRFSVPRWNEAADLIEADGKRIEALEASQSSLRRKTHCPSGHPYDDQNTRINARGDRVCRTCERARNRRSGAARRARALLTTEAD